VDDEDEEEADDDEARFFGTVGAANVCFVFVRVFAADVFVDVVGFLVSAADDELLSSPLSSTDLEFNLLGKLACCCCCGCG
jgi:hypothetical protein